MTDNSVPPTDDLLEREAKPGLSTDDKVIIALPIISGLMLGAALPNILSDAGTSGNFKIALATAGSVVVGYAVTRTAIKVGAPLFARRFRTAGAVSVIALGLVGFGFAGATITGFTATDVAQRQAQTNGTKLSQFMAKQNELALQAGRSGATLGFVAADLSQWATCEFEANCVSRAAVTGLGSITTLLEGKANDAKLIGDEFELGEQARSDALKEMNASFEEYQRTLGQSDVSIWERRIELELIHGAIIQSAAKLVEAVPVNLVDQLGQELITGVSIPGRREVEQRINDILKENGERIKGVVEGVSPQEVEPPVFPERPGVWTILTFLPKYLPLAALVTAIDLIFSMMLFIMTWLDERWKIEQEKFSRAQQRETTAFEGDDARPPSGGRSSTPRHHRTNGHRASKHQKNPGSAPHGANGQAS